MLTEHMKIVFAQESIKITIRATQFPPALRDFSETGLDVRNTLPEGLQKSEEGPSLPV